MNEVTGSILQSSAWRVFNAISYETAYESDQKWHYVAILEHGQFSNRWYCPYGPVAQDVMSFKAAIASLKRIGKNKGVDFIRIEPDVLGVTPQLLREMGFKHSRRDVQPPHTVVNDVSVGEEAIMAELSQTARRYARKCDKAGITYSVSYDPKDIDDFIKMIHDVSQRTGMKPHDDMHYRLLAERLFPQKVAGLLFAELAGKRIASIIFFNNGETMSYAHAANYTEYRKYSPATGLGLFALKFAHQQGCKWFDWYGVAPEVDDGNPRWHAWRGFTQFKLSYGGKRVDYVGTWELPLRPWRYRLYRLLLIITRR